MSGIPAKLVKEWQAKKEAAQAREADDAKHHQEKPKHKPKSRPNTDSHYRDRAQERRFHEQVQAKSEEAATKASVLASFEAPTKGLDYELLERTRNNAKLASEAKKELVVTPTASSLTSNLFKMDGSLTRNSVNATFGLIGNGVMLLDGASKDGQAKGIGAHLMILAVVGAVDGPSTLIYLNKTMCEFFLLRATKSGNIDKRWMEEAFLEYDQSLPIEQNAWTPKQHFIVGATASLILLDFKTRKVHVAHVGDSRSLIFSSTPPAKVLYASRDHVPSDPIENDRISKAGTRVVGGRIFSSTTMKSIEVSRMFGYRAHKAQANYNPTRQVVTAVCDYESIDLPSALQSEDEEDLERAIAVFIGTRGIFLSTLPILPIAGAQEINVQIADWCMQNCLHRRSAPVSASLAALIDQLGAPKKVVRGVGITTSKEELAAMEKDGRPAKNDWSAILLALRATQTLEKASTGKGVAYIKPASRASEKAQQRSRSRSRPKATADSDDRHSRRETSSHKKDRRDRSPTNEPTGEKERSAKHSSKSEGIKKEHNEKSRKAHRRESSDSEEDAKHKKSRSSRSPERRRKRKKSRSRSR